MTRDHSGWWYRASTEQKLRQIDAGIELGMTSRQIALASGAKRPQVVATLGVRHGRQFTAGQRASTSLGRQGRRLSAMAAYARGEPVDFWSNHPRAPLVNDDLPQEVAFE